jgi:hypothetical protein
LYVITGSSPNLGASYLHSKSGVSIWTKDRLGYILCNFYANTSGHTAVEHYFCPGINVIYFNLLITRRGISILQPMETLATTKNMKSVSLEL